MELSPEDRARIESEEARTFAEQKYREEVRSRMSQSPARPKKQAPKNRRWLLWSASGAAALWAVSNLTSRSEGRIGTNSGKIVSGELKVPAGSYLRYRLPIKPEMRGARLKGEFQAAGGFGNDIVVVVTEASEFANWVNGHKSRALYSTDGKKTAGRFEVPLEPGEYVLAFSNHFSLLTSKTVLADVELEWKQFWRP